MFTADCLEQCMNFSKKMRNVQLSFLASVIFPIGGLERAQQHRMKSA
jgi:hypothetical protein